MMLLQTVLRVLESERAATEELCFPRNNGRAVWSHRLPEKPCEMAVCIAGLRNLVFLSMSVWKLQWRSPLWSKLRTFSFW